MVYYGEYRGKIDAQGRLVIPARLRDVIGKGNKRIMYLVRGFEKCLFLFSEKAWSEESARLGQLSLTRSKARAFSRFFFSGVYQTKIDRQGRVLIPEILLNHAGIRDRIVVIGVGNKIEVWSEEIWNSYYAETATMASEIADQLEI
ncbi:MAG: division/cell wall cluster transcriptional repressor MraZ [Candidatus Omnitrophica bacterium]|nr:division/cell wall cluster transcriptional repressor MraZ [Candidatus Omnitrophota bacterium]